MERILNAELMVLLFKVQPPKQRIAVDYVVSRPVAGNCHPQHSACYGSCTGGCKNGCTRSCKGSSR
jgi:hypothetical protein